MAEQNPVEKAITKAGTYTAGEVIKVVKPVVDSISIGLQVLRTAYEVQSMKATVSRDAREVASMLFNSGPRIGTEGLNLLYRATAQIQIEALELTRCAATQSTWSTNSWARGPLGGRPA